MTLSEHSPPELWQAQLAMQWVKLITAMWHMQDPSKPVFDAGSEFVPLLLTFVANKSKQEVAMVAGAENVYKHQKSRKGYARRPPAWSLLLICWAQTCTLGAVAASANNSLCFLADRCIDHSLRN